MHPGQGRPLPLDVRALGGQELDMTADVSAERADSIDSAPRVIVNGQTYPLDGTPALHHRARLHPRPRAHRRQGRLRRGRMRRLLRHGGPTRRRGRHRSNAVDGDQRLPGTDRGVRRAGDRHRRRHRHARPNAPRPARDGGARRLAVWLLHARLRLQHGRRVLPSGSATMGPPTTPSMAPTASTCTR